MFEIQIASSVESYRAVVTDAEPAFEGYDFVIADSVFSHLNLGANVIWVDATEDNKTLSTVERICAQLKDGAATRSAKVAAVGGGIIQDLATLASAIYMRGISWDYFPTTLTGMMDSCLGGKSSINVGKVKNLVGNIYPPSNIFIHSGFATTLPWVHTVAGLAEGVKICFARGSAEFDAFASKSLSGIAARNLSSDDIATLAALSLGSKKWFVEVDEFDKKERQLLNFGHTFGHALEAATEFHIPHGVGVGLGMLAAIAHDASQPSEASDQLSAYTLELLATVKQDVVDGLVHFDETVFAEALLSDKKNAPGSLCHILLGQNGELVKTCIALEDRAVERATQALQSAVKLVIS